jgi:glucan phosphorylase
MHKACTNVMHNEISCLFADIPSDKWCMNCTNAVLDREWRQMRAVKLLTDIRKNAPELWQRIVEFKQQRDCGEDFGRIQNKGATP